jgi:hypothetical protein
MEEIRVPGDTHRPVTSHWQAFITSITIGLLHISRFDYKIMFLNLFYTSYFPYDGQNGTHSSKRDGKANEFGYNFLIICKYFNLVKHQSIIFCYNRWYMVFKATIHYCKYSYNTKTTPPMKPVDNVKWPIMSFYWHLENNTPMKPVDNVKWPIMSFYWHLEHNKTLDNVLMTSSGLQKGNKPAPTVWWRMTTMYWKLCWLV